MKQVTLEKHLKDTDSGIAKIIEIIAKNSLKISKAFCTQYSASCTKNTFNETQLLIDKYADTLLLKEMEKSRLVRNVASEEQNEIIEIKKGTGEFGVTIDPLDGSSCVNPNLSVGTIAGIFNEGNVMEKGNRMDAACYVIYGPLTSLTYSSKNGLHEFILNNRKEFVLKRENITIPEGKILAAGGLRKEITPQHLNLLHELEEKGFKNRFSGSFVADINQIFYYGGLFTYPKTASAPQGKLRLLFEANPISFLAKQAGGKGSNGKEEILNIKPEMLSQRTPVYVGDKKAIEITEKHLSKEN
jgi:fructose-1,6-bisphosphatase I